MKKKRIGLTLTWFPNLQPVSIFASLRASFKTGAGVHYEYIARSMYFLSSPAAGVAGFFFCKVR